MNDDDNMRNYKEVLNIVYSYRVVSEDMEWWVGLSTSSPEAN